MLPRFVSERGGLTYPLAGGLESSRLALGCMNFGGTWEPGKEVSQEARYRAREALSTALDLGWNFFDHADIYGRGRSEVVFGELVRELTIPRDSYILQTKCGIRFEGDPNESSPHRYDFSRDHIRRSVEGSLRRLQTDYVDILLLHRPDLLAAPQEIVETLQELKAEGKVHHFGVSNFPPPLLQLFESAGLLPVANQVEVSLLKPSLIEAVLVAQDQQPSPGHPADGTLEWHRRQGVVTQAWAPLAYGYFSGREHPELDANVKAAADMVRDLARDKGVKPEAIVIAWLLKHPSCIQPIIGTRDPQRIRACNEALHLDLTREEWYGLHRKARGAALA